MKKFAAVLIALSVTGLGACATSSGTATPAAKTAAAAPKGDALTGSRLVKPTTERVVKAVGNNEYNEAGNQHTAISNTVSRKSN